MGVAHGEMVEKQLDALIQRRARKGDVDPDEAEEIWKESVRRYNARRRHDERPLQNGDEVSKLGSGERLSPRPALSRRRNGASPSSRRRGPLGRRRKRHGRR
jgi:hypothetical protein